MILRKEGLWVEEWNCERRKIEKFRLPEVPNDSILNAWNDSFSIQGRVRLLDLLNYLCLPANKTMLHLIELLTGANLSAYLAEDWRSVPPVRDSESKLRFIEVYKYFELDNMDDIKNWKLAERGLSAHGIGSPPKEEKRTNNKDCSWAIEFRPWSELIHLPLRLKTTSTIEKTTWQRQKPKRVGFVKVGSKSKTVPLTGSWVQDKRLVKQESYPIQVSYTVGEFFTGLFDELCFFWSPAKRDTKNEELKQRLEESEKMDRNEFYEMKEVPIRGKQK